MFKVYTIRPLAVCGVPFPVFSTVTLTEVDLLAVCYAGAGLPLEPAGWQALAGDDTAQLKGLQACLDAAPGSRRSVQGLVDLAMQPAMSWAQDRLFSRGMSVLRLSTVSPAADDMRAVRFPDACVITARPVTVAGVDYPAGHELRTSVCTCFLLVLVDLAARWRSDADVEIARAFVNVGGVLHAIAGANGQALAQAREPEPPGPIEMRIVSMPDRETVSSIERDTVTERITRTVQVERDAS